MKNRTSGIIKRAVAVVAIFLAWLSVSRLLATWMSNHLFFINVPVEADFSNGCSSARNIYSRSWQEESLQACEPIGYEYGSGTYPDPDPGMPTSSFFGEVFTDGWGFAVAHFVGLIAMVIAAAVVSLLMYVIDGIINGFGSSHSDPCDVGQCGCDCSCCQRRKRRYAASQQSSSNLATGIALGTAIGISIGS